MKVSKFVAIFCLRLCNAWMDFTKFHKLPDSTLLSQDIKNVLLLFPACLRIKEKNLNAIPKRHLTNCLKNIIHEKRMQLCRVNVNEELTSWD